MEKNVSYIKKSSLYCSQVYWETPKHAHAFWEIVIILKGEATHFVNDVPNVMKEGDMIIMKPGSAHFYKIHDIHNYLHIDFYTNNADVKKTCDFLNSNLYETLVSDIPSVITLDENYLKSINDKLQLLLYAQSISDNSRTNVMYKTILVDLISKLIQDNLVKNSTIPEWYVKMLISLNNPSVLCGTVSNLVEVNNFSHGYMCKLFKNYTGETIVSFFTKQKLEYSKTLLYNKKLSILQISSIIGYDSLSHYIRVFKKYNMTTPRAYRKEILKI